MPSFYYFFTFLFRALYPLNFSCILVHITRALLLKSPLLLLHSAFHQFRSSYARLAKSASLVNTGKSYSVCAAQL